MSQLDVLGKLKPGDSLGAWSIEALAGSGAMGTVWRARHRETEALAAIKVLSVPLEKKLARRRCQRFVSEGETLARLSGHPHVVGVHAAGQLDNGVPWLALEWMPGGSLRDRMRVEPLDPRQALEVAAALTSALGHLHEHGVLHRDVKPENVLFDGQGRPRLADFGLVLDEEMRGETDITATGAILGTPAYLAPEGFRGQRDHVGPWTDLWAVGVMLYEMWTGERPFQATSMMGMFNAVRNTSPAPLRKRIPGLSKAAEAVCLKMLHPDPEHRYRTAMHLAADIECVLEGRVPTTGSGVGIDSALALFKKVGRAPVLPALALLAVSLVAAWSAFGERRAPSEAVSLVGETGAEARRRMRRESQRAGAKRQALLRQAELAVGRAVKRPDVDTVGVARATLTQLEGHGGEGEEGRELDSELVALTQGLEDSAYQRSAKLLGGLMDQTGVGLRVREPAELAVLTEPVLAMLELLGRTRTAPSATLIGQLLQVSVSVSELYVPETLGHRQRLSYVRRCIALRLRLLKVARVAWLSANPVVSDAVPQARRRGGSILMLLAAVLVDEHRRQHGPNADRCDLVMEARQLAAGSVEIYPALPEAHLRLVKVHYELGELSLAYARLRALSAALISQEPFFPKPWVLPSDRALDSIVRTFYLAAIGRLWLDMYFRQGSQDEALIDAAIGDFIGAARESQEPGRVLEQLLEPLRSMGRLSQALEILNNAVAAWPKDAVLQLWLGRLLLDLGQPREALEVLEKAEAGGQLRSDKRSMLGTLLSQARRQLSK